MVRFVYMQLEEPPCDWQLRLSGISSLFWKVVKGDEIIYIYICIVVGRKRWSCMGRGQDCLCADKGPGQLQVTIKYFPNNLKQLRSVGHHPTI